MKVLLVYPGLVEGFDSYANNSNWFNHGIGMISAVLKKEGHTVSYIDCRKLKGWDDFSSVIAVTDFEISLISICTVDFEPAQKIASIIKQKNPELKVMVGGPHPTLMTAETMAVQQFDYVFTHEAEVTLSKLLQNRSSAPRLIRGEMPLDLDSLPFVDRELAPEGETPWISGLQMPYFSITASRGCFYKCTFCQPAERAVFGDKVRKRSVDNILDELEYLDKSYGMKSFMIHDDCFTQYYSWVEEFCEKKVRRGLKQTFACQSRADIICKRPDLIKKLADVGLVCFFIGFESGSNRILQFIKKDVTVAENIEAARICRSFRIKIFANYMFGLPTETEEEMRQTVAMIRTIQPDICSPSVFTPAPGSELYYYCLENGLSLIESSEGYRRDANSGPKIKGVDYELVRQLVAESMRPTLTRLVRRKLGNLAKLVRKCVGLG